MKSGAWLGILLAAPVWAHVVSMSSGDLRLEGARARYELRMPLYEIAHVPHPETALLQHVRFAGAKLLHSTCTEEQARDLYVCQAEYDFGTPPDRIDVECTLSAITVPNHVHMLRAEMGDKRDQGMFDAAFPRATLRFRPPTAAETAAAEIGGGVVQALGGPVQLLFLAALALAARSRKELASLALMFLAGQVLAVLVTPHTSWQPAPRFVEAAAALTVAYLAVEILLLPKAGSRWAVAGVLGVFHGLYFHLFLQTAGYRPGFVLAGAATTEIVVLAVLALLFAQVRRWARALRPVQVSAAALLVFGMVWFVLRLRG
jgi:HupE / UreJ protein